MAWMCHRLRHDGEKGRGKLIVHDTKAEFLSGNAVRWPGRCRNIRRRGRYFCLCWKAEDGRVGMHAEEHRRIS